MRAELQTDGQREHFANAWRVESRDAVFALFQDGHEAEQAALVGRATERALPLDVAPLVHYGPAPRRLHLATPGHAKTSQVIGTLKYNTSVKMPIPGPERLNIGAPA